MMMSASVAVNAQYTAKTPEGGFDVNKGKDYVVLFAPEDVVAKMGGKVTSDQNLDPEMKRNQFFYWVTDWDDTKLVLANVEEPDGKNSWGGTTMLNMTPLFEWGGGNFGSKSGSGFHYDLSDVQAHMDDYVLHIGLRDMGNAESKYRFSIGHFDSKAKISNGVTLEVNAEVGSDNGGFIGVGSIAHDNQWYSIDIPMRDLIDEDGDFGFDVDWSEPFAEGLSVFTVAFDKPTCSKADGVLLPGDAVETYTIAELGSALSIESVFFYKADDASQGDAADVNNDGNTDISDIVAVINVIAGSDTFADRADVNHDDNTDISDIVAIINAIAEK